MLNPTFPDFVQSTPYQRCDQLLLKTDWLLTDVTSQMYVGAGTADASTSGYAAVPTGLTPFDLRPYRAGKLYLQATGITGTAVSLLIYYYDNPKNLVAVSAAQTQGIGSSNGVICLLTDDLATVSAASGGAMTTPYTYAPKPEFCLIQLLSSGTTARTTVRTALYGIR